MSRRDNWTPEDGMGFAGLVPTAQEKATERYVDAQAKRFYAMCESHAALVKSAGDYMHDPCDQTERALREAIAQAKKVNP